MFFSNMGHCWIALAGFLAVLAMNTQRTFADFDNEYRPPARQTFSHQMRSVEEDPSNSITEDHYTVGRDGRSFWKNLFKPVFVRTTKREEKKIENKSESEKATQAAVFKSDPTTTASTTKTFASSTTTTATTTETVPTAFPIPEDYEKTTTQQQQVGQIAQQGFGGFPGQQPGFGITQQSPFVAQGQSSPFALPFPAQQAQQPGQQQPFRQFGGFQGPHQQYLLQQYGSAFQPRPPKIQQGGPGQQGSDPRLIMLLQLMKQQRELQSQSGTSASSTSSADSRQEERALMDFLNSLGDRTGLSSFTNFDRLNLDFLNPIRNRFTLPILNLLTGQNRPYSATATIHDNGAPGAPPTVAKGTIVFYQHNAASPVQVELDLLGIGINARNIRIDIRNNVPGANCAGQGDTFNPTGRSSGGVVLTIGASDFTGRLKATIQNLPRESVSVASPNSIVGKSVQISEAGVIHGCGTILASNVVPPGAASALLS